MIERIAIIILANLLFFFKTLGYSYSSDDCPVSQRKAIPGKFRKWLFVLEGHSRSTPVTDHAIVTALHALVCVFMYLGLGANDISFLSAFLFMPNPINNQGSVWIGGRAYVLPALGMLMAITLPWLSPFFIYASTYFIQGYGAPIVLAGSAHPWIAIFVPIVWLIHGRRMKESVLIKAGFEMFAEDKTFGWHKIRLAIKTFGYYTAHALFPFRTTFYHAFLQSAAGSGKFKAYAWKDRWFFIGVIFIVAIAVRLTTTTWGPMNFGLLWWCIGISPFLNLFRIHQEIAERYCYLPNVGLMYALAHVLIGHPLAIATVISIYATRMWFYMDTYMDDYYLIESACMNSPDAWFSWHVRAMKRWDAKSYHEAVILWTMALRISPKEFKLNLNLATAHAAGGQPEIAKQYLKVAEENMPRGQEVQCRRFIDEFKKGNCTIVL